ncbi:20063_t:CDS:2 [Entrophospora sp. SA101]|nr:20063_t:CDS:2 [Entrophospora sp. SA101]
MNQKLRIASFNIRYDSKGIDPSPRATNEGFIINQKLEKRQAKEQPWNIRKYKVADTILFHKIDVIGIQEAIYSQIKDLESLLAKNNDDDWGWVGVGRHDGKPDGNEGGEFTPIFYNKNRLKLLDFEHFWLSETPNVPNSMGWDAKLTRVVTQARIMRLLDRRFSGVAKGVGRHDGKPDGNEGGEFTPIFYNKNRLKLLDFEH